MSQQKPVYMAEIITNLANEILAAHNPKEVEEASVSLIFSDGEHVSTKAGDLFGMRTMHLMDVGLLPHTSWGKTLQAILNERMPQKYGDYRCIYCSFTTARKLVEKMKQFTQGELFTVDHLEATCNEAVILSRTIMQLTDICDALGKLNGKRLAERRKQNPRAGDVVEIRAQGVTRKGVATCVDKDGDFWMIEGTDTASGKAFYWKQRHDGGALVSVEPKKDW